MLCNLAWFLKRSNSTFLVNPILYSMLPVIGLFCCEGQCPMWRGRLRSSTMATTEDSSVKIDPEDLKTVVKFSVLDALSESETLEKLQKLMAPLLLPHKEASTLLLSKQTPWQPRWQTRTKSSKNSSPLSGGYWDQIWWFRTAREEGIGVCIQYPWEHHWQYWYQGLEH